MTTTLVPLTDRQRDVYRFIGVAIAQAGYPPTVREVAAHLGIHVNAARNHLDALVKKGWVVRDEKRSRGLRLIGGDL